MKHGSLFSRIGGFDLAAEWMGWENVFHCEWNPFGQRVLKHYWPNAKNYEDITQTDFTIHRGSIDILTGGFPCQPYSAAGKRLGKEDERHLWPEMLRVIREVAPKYIVGENVLGLVNWNGGLVFDEVQADLEAEGYEVATVVIPAAAVNAPHGRDRVWFVAQNTMHSGCVQREFSEEGASVRKQRNAGTGNSERICGAEMARLTSDTDSRGLEGSIEVGWNSEHVERKSKFGLTADTESESSERLRPEQQEFSQSEQGEFGRNGGKVGDGLTADTDSDGQHERNSNDEINASERRINAQCDFGKGDDDGNVADTSSIGLERECRPIRELERRFRFGSPNTRNFQNSAWQNFPTQSPICGRDDGLPTELDGITFSKWRNESIKAYGNAIVPQVAFEIFKVIEKADAL